MLNKHHGEIIEKAVRNCGLTITEISKSLFVERKSIYNWFKAKNVSPDVIYRLGNVINHDFSQEFPEFFVSSDFKVSSSPLRTLKSAEFFKAPDAILWKDKYLQLLEKHAQLLSLKLNQVTDNM